MALPILKAQPQHRSFIISTWVKSYAHIARKLLKQAVYNAEEPKLAEALWQHSSVVVSPSDDYTVHAWVCGDIGKLYHCYVIPELRAKGVAKALIEGVCGNVLQYARPWPFPVERSGWQFNPYLLAHK